MRPIDYACVRGQIGIVKFYFQNQLDLQQPNIDGMRPIHYACANGQIEIVKFYFRYELDLQQPNYENGMRPIDCACANGQIEIVKFFFQNQLDFELPNNKGMRPLDYACERGQIEIVKFFFDNQLDLQQPNKIGMRPIDYACKRGQIEIVKLFYQNQLDLEQPNVSGKKPIHYAFENERIEIVIFLFENGLNIADIRLDYIRCIHCACKGGHVDFIKFLIRNNCDFETQDRTGWRPIHHAVKGLHIEIVKCLIRHHCDLEAKTNTGQTPLGIAKDLKKKEMIELLESNILRLKIIKRIEDASMKSCGIFCNHSFCSKQIFSNQSQNQGFIATGGFGLVYKIRDPQTKVDIAVKVVNNKELPETENLENNINDYRDKLFHERIMQYYFVLRNDSKTYIFMEWAPLGSLHDVIQKNGPLEHSKIIRYSQQILEGLEFLHENCYIHRDVKPKNILMFPNDCIKLCDFGVSRVIETISNSKNKGGADSAVGTVNYMAPELITCNVDDKGKYDYAVDIWSLGASMIEMLTSEAPYSQLEPQAVMFKIGIEKSIKFEPCEPMSQEFTKFHFSMLEINPVKRPTASKLLIEIKDLL